MLARRRLLAEYEEWNRRWGAPHGRDLGDTTIRQRLASPDAARFGPFAFQISNHTRRFEYPWAFFTARPRPGLRVLDVGGGLSGLQFVLAAEGCEVTNVDPEAAVTERTWSQNPTFGLPLTAERHRRVNEIFGTGARLVPARVQDADLRRGSFDVAVCLSVIEHVDQDEAAVMLKATSELLRPGGLCLLTIDLFLDVKPFGVLSRNVWGTNVDVHELVSGVDLVLAHGDPRELLGFPEFDLDRVVGLLPELLIGQFSALSQSLVLAKPA